MQSFAMTLTLKGKKLLFLSPNSRRDFLLHKGKAHSVAVNIQSPVAQN